MEPAAKKPRTEEAVKTAAPTGTEEKLRCSYCTEQDMAISDTFEGSKFEGKCRACGQPLDESVAAPLVAAPSRPAAIILPMIVLPIKKVAATVLPINPAYSAPGMVATQQLGYQQQMAQPQQQVQMQQQQMYAQQTPQPNPSMPSAWPTQPYKCRLCDERIMGARVAEPYTQFALCPMVASGAACANGDYCGSPHSDYETQCWTMERNHRLLQIQSGLPLSTLWCDSVGAYVPAGTAASSWAGGGGAYAAQYGAHLQQQYAQMQQTQPAQTPPVDLLLRVREVQDTRVRPCNTIYFPELPRGLDKRLLLAMLNCLEGYKKLVMAKTRSGTAYQAFALFANKEMAEEARAKMDGTTPPNGGEILSVGFAKKEMT